MDKSHAQSHGDALMSGRGQFRFRLYTAEGTRNAVRALADLTALCESRWPGNYEIEVVDVLREPQRARADDIRMTPTLIKLAPNPGVRIVGSLHRSWKLLAALDTQVDAA
jgi:circadian clock protein KaiB